MKKIILLCLILFVISCSNDNEIKTSESPVAIKSLKTSTSLPEILNATNQMFYEYVTSDIYIEVRQLVTVFNKNLYKDDNFKEFNNEAEIFSWIDGNIRFTNFKSTKEARSNWLNIKEKLHIEINTFPSIYAFIKTAPRQTVLEYIHKWEISITLFDNNYCQDAFNICSAGAAGKFAGDSAMAVDPKTGMADLSKQAAAVQKFVKNATICMNDYKKCLGIK